jgi:dTDP-4-dehydrorhamnose 3,5-epimerase-like enzyme
MTKIIELKSFSDSRGSLTVIEKILPFSIKRVYYIYNLNQSKRGFHKHKKTQQALICISGSCSIFIDNKSTVKEFILDFPNKCLILEPSDFHWMDNFSKNCVLLVLASEEFDKNDYIYEN